MQQIISELYQQTSTQSILTKISWFMIIVGLLYILDYISIHQFDDKNLKYLLKMLTPLTLAICIGAYTWYDNYQSLVKVKDPNIENFKIKKERNTLHFVSKNQNLKNADFNIVAENEEYLYLKYDEKIIEIKKDELKLNN